MVITGKSERREKFNTITVVKVLNILLNDSNIYCPVQTLK